MSLPQTNPQRTLMAVCFLTICFVLSTAPAWCLYDMGAACPSSVIIGSTDQTTWVGTSITVNVNSTVYFKGVDPVLGGHIVPMVDTDTQDSVAKKQGTNSLQLQWDLSYISQNGFNQTNTCWPLDSVSKTYTTAGTYYVYLRVDDVGTIFNDPPCYANAVYTVHVQ